MAVKAARRRARSDRFAAVGAHRFGEVQVALWKRKGVDASRVAAAVDDGRACEPLFRRPRPRWPRLPPCARGIDVERVLEVGRRAQETRGTCNSAVSTARMRGALRASSPSK